MLSSKKLSVRRQRPSDKGLLPIHPMALRSTNLGSERPTGGTSPERPHTENVQPSAHSQLNYGSVI